MKENKAKDPWVVVALYDQDGRLVRTTSALRWAQWPGIMVFEDRYFKLSKTRENGSRASYVESDVHFLPAKEASNAKT